MTDEIEHVTAHPASRPLVAAAVDDEERSDDEMDSTSEHSHEEQQPQLVTRDVTSDKSHGLYLSRSHQQQLQYL